MQTFDDAAARAVASAVRDVESRSAAELVVEIRLRSGSYAHADGRFAATIAIASLVVLVFMPFVVPPEAVILDPIGVYLAGIFIARRSAAIRRLFATRNERTTAVRTHAAALFHDRGVANTSGETGLLLYASALERRIEVLADRGLLRRVAPNDWNALMADLRQEHDITPDRVITAIRTLGALFERDAPRMADDVNELPDLPEIES